MEAMAIKTMLEQDLVSRELPEAMAIKTMLAVEIVSRK